VTTTGPRTPHDESRRGGIQLAMPENHLDVVVTPDSVDPQRPASLRTTIIAVVSMPLFFLLAFTLCYVSATHAPSPHDMALTISGPADVTEQIADAIDSRAEGAFDITRTTDSDAAREAVTDRDAVGALIVDGQDVTTVVASAAGRVATPVITSVGAQVASSLGGTSTVEDAVPLPADDPGGSILFLFLVICTVGGFLSITVISQTVKSGGLRPLLATAAGAALVVPVIGFSMVSVFVDFEVPFGTTAAVIGVGMVYTLTVALIATLFDFLLGQAAVLGVILVVVALSFPSSGGSVPGAMLPPFWQVLHEGWLGAGAYESMRGILFFDGAQVSAWLTQLLVWTGAVILLLVIASVAKRRRSRARVDSTPAGIPNTATPAPTPADQLDSEQEIRLDEGAS